MAHKSKKGLPFPMTLPVDITTQLVDRILAFTPSVKADYLKEVLLTKFVSRDTDPAPLRRERAIAKWLATEVRNEETNERIINSHEEFQILPRVPFNVFVEWCRCFVISIIGEVPTEEALVGSFSGGASTSRNRRKSHPALKFTGKAHITRPCREVWETAKSLMPGWLSPLVPLVGAIKPQQNWIYADGYRPARYGPSNWVNRWVDKGVSPLEMEDVNGNVLFTVPKKSDIDRVACKEPDLNMFIQKGIGDVFRRRLRAHGINLNDQSKNQRLAREGSITGKLVTLDLSSASDSVSTGLVSLLIPPLWFTLLSSSRSEVTVIDGDEHRNHMFSSMGNGFTFELESLIFFTLGKAVAHFTRTSGVVSVYGDDIICPTDMHRELTWVLKYFGFLLNEEKSCTDGPFRESCGGHYWNGYDITPFYIREPIVTVLDVIDVANQLRRWGEPSCLGLIDPEVEETWLWLKQFVPRCLWGGWDTTFKYQLVSRDTPEMRLSEEVSKSGTGIGGYYQWLCATRDREFLVDGVATSRKQHNLSRYRLKRALPSAVNRLETYFLHELG